MDWSAVASFGKGAATGVKDGAVSLAEGLWSLGKGAVNAGFRAATDPAYRQAVMDGARSLADSAVDYGGRLLDDPATRAEAYEQVQDLAGSLKDRFIAARDQAEREGRLAEFYGNIAGRGGFEVGTFIVPVAKLGALGKAGDLAKAAAAADLAKAAEGAQALAAAKAGQAVQKCVATANKFVVLVNGSERLVGAERAAIDVRKLTEYALNPLHPKGGDKARVFESALGFNKGNAEELLAQLRDGVTKVQPIAGKVDEFGSRFTLDIPVVGPKGAGLVRTGWIYKAGSEVPELATLFVK